nr:MAG TPA: hypothetical protein [Caudoviricetes sp.]
MRSVSKSQVDAITYQSGLDSGETGKLILIYFILL